MESERAQNFNDRLNQWIAGQGFWFQLRHSMLGAGGGGARGVQMVQLAFRLVIFLLILAAAGVVYLFYRTDGEGFRKKVESSLIEGLDAKKGSLASFQRSQGKLVVSRFVASGNEGTFFTELDARNLSCQMNLFDGVFGKWAPGTLTIAKLDLDLRAGAKDAKSAETLGDALFRQYPDLDLKNIEVEDATVSWGYSAVTRGVIEGSQLNIRRGDSDWRLQFKGGKFSQNWLRGLEIEELVVSCGREGVVFEKAIFKNGAGRVDLKGLTVKGKEQPIVSGLLKISHLPLDDLLTAATENFLEGTISGEFKVSGSTNSPEGIAFDGKISLTDDDELTLRDRLPLLRALSVVDGFTNYRRVTFHKGSMMMKTGGGKLTLNDLSLRSDDLLNLSGDLVVRNPTQEELKKKPSADSEERSPIFNSPNADTDTASADFVPKRTTKDSTKDAQDDPAGDLARRADVRRDERKATADAIERAAGIQQYEGELEISLRADSLERSEKLRAEFPVNEKTGRIPIKVPIRGTLSDITLKQAEDLHQKGRR